MKPIRFVQWSSSVSIALIVIWSIGFTTWGIITKEDPTKIIAGIAKIDTVLALFVAPEKAAAFFGPALKRKQSGGANE